MSDITNEERKLLDESHFLIGVDSETDKYYVTMPSYAFNLDDDNNFVKGDVHYTRVYTAKDLSDAVGFINDINDWSFQ